MSKKHKRCFVTHWAWARYLHTPSAISCIYSSFCMCLKYNTASTPVMSYGGRAACCLEQLLAQHRLYLCHSRCGCLLDLWHVCTLTAADARPVTAMHSAGQRYARCLDSRLTSTLTLTLICFNHCLRVCQNFPGCRPGWFCLLPTGYHIQPWHERDLWSVFPILPAKPACILTTSKRSLISCKTEQWLLRDHSKVCQR